MARSIESKARMASEPTYRIVLACLCFLFAANVVAHAVTPGPDAEYAVVVSPHAPASAAAMAVAAADGLIVRSGPVDWLVIARPAGESSDFGAKLRNAGAWFLLNPMVVAGCFSRPDGP